MKDVNRLALAAKDISFFPGWSKPEAETLYLWFDAPLEIDGITETGLVLHGGCIADRPDCHVTFEVRINRASSGVRCLPLARLDWKSLTDGHSNPRRTGNALSGARVRPTHFHDFDLNWDATRHRMQSGNLRFARDVDPIPADFEALLTIAEILLKINNIGVVTRPPWVYDLFQIGG